jgi:hypothetical protein
VYLRIPLPVWRKLLQKTFPPHGVNPKGVKVLDTLTEADYRDVIPEEVISEMCTLVKGNSIEGGKLSEVRGDDSIHLK